MADKKDIWIDIEDSASKDIEALENKEFLNHIKESIKHILAQNLVSNVGAVKVTGDDQDPTLFHIETSFMPITPTPIKLTKEQQEALLKAISDIDIGPKYDKLGEVGGQLLKEEIDFQLSKPSMASKIFPITKKGTMENPLELIWSKGVLVDLTIRRPTFKKKLNSRDLLLDYIDPEVFNLGHKKLIYSKDLRQIVRIGNEARKFLERFTTRFPISKARFVTIDNLNKVIDKLEDYKKQMQDIINHFKTKYPELKLKQKLNICAQYDKIYNQTFDSLNDVQRVSKGQELKDWLVERKKSLDYLYPPEETIDQAFSMEWTIFKVVVPETFGQTDIMTDLEAAEINKARIKISTEVNKWAMETATQAHKVLGMAAAKAADLLKSQGKLTAKNLKPLAEAIEAFKTIDIGGQSHYRAIVNNIALKYFAMGPDGNIDYTTSISNIEHESGFSDLVDGIKDLAIDEVAEDAGLKALGVTGEYKRLIEV